MPQPTTPAAPTRIRVSGIATPEEARLAIEAGVDAIAVASPGVAPAGSPIEVVFVARGATADLATASAIQVDDADAIDAIDATRAVAPNARIIAAIEATDELALDEAFRAGERADELLVVVGRPHAPSQAADFTLARRIVGAERLSHVPVWLAGGLTAENVAEAIRTAAPFGVDVDEGVRTNGALDPIKLRAFVEAVREST